MSRSTAIILAVVAGLILIACCVCLVAGLGAWFFLSDSGLPVEVPNLADATRTPVVIRPTPGVPGTSGLPATPLEPVSTPLPGETPAPTGTADLTQDAALDTLTILQSATVPASDLFELASRLEGKSDAIDPTLEPPAAPFEVGARQSFWVSNSDTNENFQVQATLRYVTPHSYFWIENSVTYDEGELRQLAETFENSIYPRDREFFGSEWTPGVDGDPHLYILYASGLGSGVAGYFSSLDSYPPALVDYSNGHEMFLFNADNTSVGEEYAYAVLAHEFQHMIQWYQDRDETRWLNEGLSDLAMLLNGYSIGGHDYLFALNPDLQLNGWPTDESSSAANYGAAFLFVTYFLDRFGEGMTRALVADPANGLDSFEATLAQAGATDPQTGAPLTVDDFFLDWTITNLLHDESAGDGRFRYHNYPDAPSINVTEEIDRCPLDRQVRDVRQYGVDYIRITCSGSYTLDFEGSIQVPVVPADPHSGSYAFWSNVGDESDITLTRSFDFTGHTGPLTLTYWTWYDLEADFDYLYLLASTDGEHWQMLRPPSATNADPTGANYGWGYNGASGGGDSPVWIQEQVDLSEFAGQQVQLRFEYITDPGVNGEGFLLDDVAIPETGYSADFETDAGGWEPAGFVRIQNVLPQTFRLALITRGEGTQVQYIPLSPDVSAQVSLRLEEGVEEAVLVVTGTSRYTRQPAAYRFSIRP